MERIEVNSSQVRSVGYDPARRALEVEFKSGGIYGYADVPPEEHEHLLKAESCGRCLNERIKGKFEFKRLNPPAKE